MTINLPLSSTDRVHTLHSTMLICATLPYTYLLLLCRASSASSSSLLGCLSSFAQYDSQWPAIVIAGGPSLIRVTIVRKWSTQYPVVVGQIIKRHIHQIEGRYKMRYLACSILLSPLYIQFSLLPVANAPERPKQQNKWVLIAVSGRVMFMQKQKKKNRCTFL